MVQMWQQRKNSPGAPSMGRAKHSPESGDTTTARFADAGVPAWRRLDGLALILALFPLFDLGAEGEAEYSAAEAEILIRTCFWRERAGGHGHPSEGPACKHGGPRFHRHASQQGDPQGFRQFSRGKGARARPRGGERSPGSVEGQVPGNDASILLGDWIACPACTP
jgi:hypothetical protein